MTTTVKPFIQWEHQGGTYEFYRAVCTCGAWRCFDRNQEYVARAARKHLDTHRVQS